MTKHKGFTTPFGDASGYVMEGDSIHCTVDGFDVTARIIRDDYTDRPEDTQDGFWPRLDPKDAGYIGPKSQAALRRARAHATYIMDSWEASEWFYCGVVVSVSKDGVPLTKNRPTSLWGIECNFPINRKRANAYLLQVANELLPEALDDAKHVLNTLLEEE